MNSDGTKVQQLTNGSSPGNSSVSWSPDGNWIAFQNNVGDWEIFLISKDGSVVIQLTDNDVYDANPAWKP
jgi:Tol biopolymer transport system component